MAMNNLIECSYHYSKTSRILYQLYRDDPEDTIADSEIKFKSRFSL